jgi:anti-sigma regulatory factor (Ser/Thr protein kinase)
VLPREPASARRARHLLLDALAEDGLERSTSSGVAELLVSELATNAVRYGAGDDFRIEVDLEAGALRVAVHDRSRVVPSPRHTSPVEVGGRGLKLVDTLAAAWGAEETADGKVVWFTLAVEERSASAG